MSNDTAKSEARSRTCKNSGATCCSLLPCPWCGSDPYEFQDGKLWCSNDECQSRKESKITKNDWNKRHSEPHRSYWIAGCNSADRILKETIREAKEELSQVSFMEWLGDFVS